MKTPKSLVRVNMINSGSDTWSTRKTLSFKSQEQYERYARFAKKRGLTTAKFFSWMAEAFIEFDEGKGAEEIVHVQGTERDTTHIHVVCSKEERDLVKSLAQAKGLSMGHYLLLSSIKPSGKPSGSEKQVDRSEVLTAVTLCLRHVEFEDLVLARNQLKTLIDWLNTTEKGGEGGFDCS